MQPVRTPVVMAAAAAVGNGMFIVDLAPIGLTTRILENNAVLVAVNTLQPGTVVVIASIFTSTRTALGSRTAIATGLASNHGFVVSFYQRQHTGTPAHNSLAR